jgi:hypothetical protein
VIVVTGLIIYSSVSGQELVSNNSEINYRYQIELRHDNDFIVLTDRYYSFGLFLTFRQRLQTGIFGSDREQIQLSLSEEAFTPSNTKTDEIPEMDRPYAGFLGLKSGWSIATNNDLIELALLFGIAGKNSGAGAFQRWYHNAVVISDPQTWVDELDNSLHVNLYGSYTYEWQLTDNPFSVHIAARPQIAFGSRDIFFHPELVAYFGRKSPIDSGISYNRIGSREREIFFSIRTGYRLVGSNGLLEGNLFGDNSVFLTESKSGVFHLGFDLQHRFETSDYRLGYRFNSAENSFSESHQYIILSYAKGF